MNFPFKMVPLQGTCCFSGGYIEYELNYNGPLGILIQGCDYPTSHAAPSLAARDTLPET